MKSGIYIHFPFCLHKCRYCAFYSITFDTGLSQNYIDCIIQESNIQSRQANNLEIESIYFGGGTPSLINTHDILRIIQKIEKNFHLSLTPEITLESNPATIGKRKARELTETRINRISIGFQSFDKDILSFLGRIHQVRDNYITYDILRNSGFNNISADLMFAIPGQTMRQWEHSLKETINLKPEHISLYCFSFDPNTELTRLQKCGKISAADEETELSMFKKGIELLTSYGYRHYEISNFALPEHEAVHNKLYWNNYPYVGLGTAAFSYIKRKRFCCLPDVNKYISNIKSRKPIYKNPEQLSDEKSLRETSALNIRLLKEGINFTKLENLYPGLNPEKILRDTIYNLIKDGLLEQTNSGSFCLTQRGIYLSDFVASQIV